jgi:hypothetical protein
MGWIGCSHYPPGWARPPPIMVAGPDPSRMSMMTRGLTLYSRDSHLYGVSRQNQSRLAPSRACSEYRWRAERVSALWRQHVGLWAGDVEL